MVTHKSCPTISTSMITEYSFSNRGMAYLDSDNSSDGKMEPIEKCDSDIDEML